MSKKGYVYIISNKQNGVLYTGVTSDLVRRVYQHKNNLYEGFSNKYKLKNLVWFEVFDDIKNAIIKEKQIKNWKRDWKIKRIEENNPTWNDLYQTIIQIAAFAAMTALQSFWRRPESKKKMSKKG